MSISAREKQLRRAPTRAERRAQTRTGLVDAAERLFKRDGFHATSLDAIADEAGYTKGAVYSNFDSKEDVFFAVYERRLDARVAELELMVRSAPSAAAAARAMTESLRTRPDDGWLAVFFEFWAHVLRNPGHRERFAELHRRALEPTVQTARNLAAERGLVLSFPPELIGTALVALGNGLQLERLTRPAEIDTDTICALLTSWSSPLTEGTAE